MHCLLKSFIKISQGETAHRKIRKQETFRAGRSGEEPTFDGDREWHAERQTYGSCMKLQGRQTSAAPFCDHEMREMHKQCLEEKAPRSTQLSNVVCTLYPTWCRTSLCFEKIITFEWILE